MTMANLLTIHDPESIYKRLVQLCNEMREKNETIVRLASFLSTDQPEGVAARRVLLGIKNEDCSPTWNDLFHARLSNDLDSPSVLHYSEDTKSVSLRVDQYNELDHSVPKKRRKNHPTDAHEILKKHIQDLIVYTARTLHPDNTRVVHKINYATSSIFRLFGINNYATSLVLVRHHIREISFANRKKIVARLLDLASKHDGTVFTLKRRSAIAIYKDVTNKTRTAATVDSSSSTTSTTKTDEEVDLDLLSRDSSYQREQDCSISKTNDQSSISLNDDNSEHNASSTCAAIEPDLLRTLAHPIDPEHCFDSLPLLLPGHCGKTIYCRTRSDSNRSDQPPSVATAATFADSDDNCPTMAYRMTGTVKIGDERNSAFINYLFANRGNPAEAISHRVKPGYSLRVISLTPTRPAPSTKQKQTPSVFTISPFLTDQFKLEIIKCLDTLPFVRGRGGRSQSYVRICTSASSGKGRVFFQISRYIYEAVKASETELHILALVNNLLNIQHRCSQQQHGQSNSPKHSPEVVNTLQIIVERMTRSSGYGRHSDAGPLVTRGYKTLSDELSADLEGLPDRAELQTFTIVLTTEDDDLRETHDLCFFDGTSKVASVPINGNMLHAQLHGSQFFEHEAKYRTSNASTGALRIVISARFTKPITNACLLDELFDHTTDKFIVKHSEHDTHGIITLLTTADSHSFINNDSHPIIDNDDDDNSSTTTSVNTHNDDSTTSVLTESDRTVAVRLANDAYRSSSIDDLSRAKITRCPKFVVSYPQEAWRFISRGDVSSKALLDHNVAFSIELGTSPQGEDNGHRDGHTRHLDVFFRPKQIGIHRSGFLLKPLSKWPVSLIAADSDISYNSRAHPPTTTDERFANVLILSQPYKNDESSLTHTVDLLLRLFHTGYKSKHDNTDLSDAFARSYVDIYGSGGAPTTVDNYSCDISLGTASAARFRTPCPQTGSNNMQNNIFCRLTERRGIVAVFIAYANFKSILPTELQQYTQATQDDVIFLGYYYFGSYHYGSDRPRPEVHIGEEGPGDRPRPDVHIGEEWPGDPLENNRDDRSKSWEGNHMYSLFTQELHFTFRLFPVFDTLAKMKHSLTIQDNVTLRIPRSVALSREIIKVDFGNNRPACGTNNTDFIDMFLHRMPPCFLKTDRTPDAASTHAPSPDERRYVDRVLNSEFRCTDSDILAHLIFLMVAGSYRALRLNVKLEENGWVSGPIPPNIMLPSIYRAHPMPMPMRSYDVMPTTLRICARQLGILEQSRRSNNYRRSHNKICEGMMFRAILNRLTGRRGVFSAYGFAMGDRAPPALLPDHREIVDFLKFIKKYKFVRLLFSCQHTHALPRKSLGDEDYFVALATCIADGICAIHQTTIARGAGRNEAVTTLGEFLSDAVDTVNQKCGDSTIERYNKKDAEFLAHQVIADLEEIYVEPFGKVTYESVRFGSGAVKGLQYMAKHIFGGRTNSRQQLCDLWLNHLAAFMVSSRVGSINMNVGKALGCKILEDGNAVLAINHRELTAADVEHHCCKIFAGIAKTSGGRGATDVPQTSRPGLHPIGRMPLWLERNFECQIQTAIFLDVLEEFRTSTSSFAVPSCPAFMIPGETFPVPNQD